MAIVGCGLAVAGIGLVTVLRQTLTENVETEARVRAGDVAAEIRRGNLATAIPDGRDDTTVVQVVAGGLRVVAQSTGIRSERALLVVNPPAAGRSISRTLHHPPMGDGAAYRAVAVATPSTPDGSGASLVVIAAGSLELVDESATALARLLAVGLPALALLVGGTTWWLVGRSLSPVEAIRRDVARISARGLVGSERSGTRAVGGLDRVTEPGVDDEIGRLARTMNEMLGRLDAANQRQRAFVSDASHELRSPLAAVRAQLEVAIAHPDRVDWAIAGPRILGQQTRVERLVEDLLLLARADERPRPRSLDVVDLDELVLREVEPMRAREQVTVDLAGMAGGRLHGDTEQLGRVVRNLLDNAEHHAVSRVTVELGVSFGTKDGEADLGTGAEGTVVLRVGDDGPGIPPADREHVFERFARLDDARNRDHGGAGLGLAIVRELVVAHGGTVHVVDSEGGACIEVRLPRAGADPD